jgi:hypothetical protein
MRRLPLIALLAAVTITASAQRSSNSAHSAARPGSPAPPARSLSTVEVGTAPRRSQNQHPRGLPLLPFGLFSDSLFSDAATDQPAASPSSAPNLIDVLSALGKPSQPPPLASQPLLIELQGDRYVRINSAEGQSENRTESHEPVTVVAESTPASAHHATPAAIHAPPIARELAPAVLVFRDGHTEEVRDYSIVGGTMYARGDYYTDGYWNKKIELAALNLPVTLKSNEARGVHFILPNAPNEVVTRP